MKDLEALINDLRDDLDQKNMILEEYERNVNDSR